MSFQECMPAQQISPSAARRSPWSLATLAASRNVSAIFLVLPLGSASQWAGPSAESMRMTPYLRTPCSLSISAMRQAFSTASDEIRAVLVAAHRRAADGAGQTGATSEPTARPLAAILSAMRAQVVVAGVGIGVRMEQEQIDAFELLAVDVGVGRQLEHAVEADRRMVGAGLLADEAGPHGVVEFWVGVCCGHGRVLCGSDGLILCERVGPLLPVVADLRQLLVHVGAEVAQADERLAAGVFDFDAGGGGFVA